LGIGDWGLGPIPNPQSPIPNPQSPIPNPHFFRENIIKQYLKNRIYILSNLIFKINMNSNDDKTGKNFKK
jgi:hypothetical protein